VKNEATDFSAVGRNPVWFRLIQRHLALFSRSFSASFHSPDGLIPSVAVTILPSPSGGAGYAPSPDWAFNRFLFRMRYLSLSSHD